MPTDPKFLREFSCFSNLSDNQVNSIAEITTAVCYPSGYALFEEGQPGNRLFFLVKGKVEVLYNIGEDGQTHVDTLTDEEIVGCSALVEPYRYSATERSLTEVEVLEVDAVSLRKLMQKDCNLEIALQQQMIRILMNRILDLRLGAR
jgi:CRP/FNR family transcriptional regulator